MADLKVKQVHDPCSGIYSARQPKEYWERFRPILEDYNAQGLSRKAIVSRAQKEHGFKGSESAMNTRFKAWGLTNSRISTSEHSSASVSGTDTSDESRQRSFDATSEPLSDLDDVKDASAEGINKHSTWTHGRLTEDATQSEDSDEVDEADVRSNSVGSGENMLQNEPFIGPSGLSISEKMKDDEWLESHDLVVQHANTEALVQVAKRLRSPRSSFRSSWSSDTRSFVQFAKRIRCHSATESLSSSLKRLSVGSSRKSSLFGLISGYGADLEIVYETSAKQAGVMPNTGNAPNTRRYLKRVGPHGSRATAVLSELYSLHFPEVEFDHFHPLSMTDIHNIDDYLRTKSLGDEEPWALSSPVGTLVPAVGVVQIYDLMRLDQEWEGLVVPYNMDSKKRYLLLAKHQINPPTRKFPRLCFPEALNVYIPADASEGRLAQSKERRT